MSKDKALSSGQFKKELAEAIPHLRAFGRSLAGDRDVADDLVQDTLLKAWAARDRFIAGTSSMRRKKFTGNYDELAAERILSAPASQQDPLHLADLQRGLMELSDDQREAIILVGAGGYSYEEAAEIANCAIGTMKSRVSRARKTLEEILDEGRFTSASDGHENQTATALENIIGAVEKIAS